MVIFAPSMWYPDLFRLFGWLIVVTAVALLLLPWRWHYEFGKWAIPLVIRHMKALRSRCFRAGNTHLLWRVSCRALLKMSVVYQTSRWRRTAGPLT